MSTFDNLVSIPRTEWIEIVPNYKRLSCWRGDAYIVQVIEEPNGVYRISVHRHDQADGISWDHLQAIKSAIGFGERDAVEAYPKDKDVLNVANYRHLWVLPFLMPCFWRVNNDPDKFCAEYIKNASTKQ